MKKFLLTGLVALASVLTVTSACHAQKASKTFVYENNSAVLPQAPFGLDVSSVNTKAMRDFRKTFPTVEGENWYKLRDIYTAEFTQADVKYRVEYDLRGNWIGTVREYKESKLDSEIRRIIKSKYYDYNIFWIKEITVSNLFEKPFYFVHIEDAKSFKNVCVYDEELKVLEDFQKSGN